MHHDWKERILHLLEDLDDTSDVEFRNSRRDLERHVGRLEGVRDPEIELEDMLSHKGIELFSYQCVRSHLTSRIAPGVLELINPTGIDLVIDPWKSSSMITRRLLGALGLPPDLLIRGSSEQEEKIERIERSRLMPPLREYQQEICEQLRDRLDNGEHFSVLVPLPTGGGKTRTAGEAVLGWFSDSEQRKVFIWLAHTKELCSQAAGSLSEIWRDMALRDDSTTTADRDMTLIRYWDASLTDRQAEMLRLFDDLDDHLLIIATYQQLHERLSADDVVATRLIQDADILVVDEAHYGPEYQTEIIRRSPHLSLIGLTATPEHDDIERTAELRRRFPSVVLPQISLELANEADMHQQMVNRGYLAATENIEVDVWGHLHGDQLDDQMWNTEQPRHENVGFMYTVRDTIVSELERDPTCSMLVFLDRISQTHLLKVIVDRLLRQRDMESECAAISSETGRKERNRIVDGFREGTISVLINVELLTTGFDAPRVNCVMIARSTERGSPTELQMIGRGLRGPKARGTDSCRIIRFRN